MKAIEKKNTIAYLCTMSSKMSQPFTWAIGLNCSYSTRMRSESS